MLTCPACGQQTAERYRRCGSCGALLSSSRAQEEVRREVTIVTSDWKGSTALGEKLDPESLREVQTRYFDAMRALFESRGGTIEKIIGDAIVAVFGLPTHHEDDSLRAVEAAAESQRVLASLNDLLEARWGVRLITRTGVATGEAVVGEATAGQHVLTGAALQVATAMEQNAPAGEVLLSESTYRSVRDLVEAEPQAEVRVKGSGLLTPAFRLISVSETAAPQLNGADRPADARLCGVCGEDNPVDFRHCGTCGAPLAERAPARESRKTVTIVFADPKPATRDGSPPDPPALREVMTRYFEGMQRALGRHGATVEKFIGDAVMAVFGLPQRHEDDALRAIRAAAEMQKALPELNARFETEFGITLANHIGVNTGEVVAGDASLGQRLVTGDTVNVAARLEQASGPQEILLGELTYRLVRDAVEAEPVEPLTLKGKSEPMPAYRLLGVTAAGEGVRRRLDTPMVGRDTELATLSEIFEKATSERVCRLATVIGDAGVGKSRLIAEFAGRCGPDSQVVRGRCLPYGDGITFWPLREAARSAAGIGEEEPTDVALAKLRAVAADEAVAARLASAIGLGGESFPVNEIFWAARRFLERLGADRPVLMIVDDLHWAEQTFLELVQSLAANVSSAPVMILCSSRQELLEKSPDFGTEEGSVRLVLEPLTDAAASRVIAALLGGTGLSDQVQAKILEAAAGNPLFVEQLLSKLIDDGTLRRGDDGAWQVAGDLETLEVPPTIHALLAARIDLLAGGERGVIEPASVIGQTFLEAAIADLVPNAARPDVPDCLGSLERKQLVIPSEGTGTDDLAYRFGHVLIRDAAYGGLLKRARAELHERFVDWATEFNAQRGLSNQEFEEIHGYHLEQAYLYLTDLGTLDRHAREVGIRASEKLASAGRRAMIRGDLPAAASLLRRAAATRDRLDPERLRLLPILAETLTELGEFDEVRQIVREASDAATDAGDKLVAAHIRLVDLYAQVYSGDAEEESAWTATVDATTSVAIPLFAEAGYDAGLTFAWRMRAGMHGAAQQWGQAAAAAEQVIEHAQRTGDFRAETRVSIIYADAALFGPTPVQEAIERINALAERARGDQHAFAALQLQLAQLYAMRGDVALARETYRAAREKLAELKAGIYASGTSLDAARVEIAAENLEAAEDFLRRDYEALTSIGENYVRATVAGLLARTLEAQGRAADAAEFTRIAEEISAPDDLDAQAIWRGVKARIHARAGEFADALRLANEAVELRERGDMVVDRAEALVDLADLHDASGNSTAADALRRAALDLVRAKGDLVLTRKIEAIRATSGKKRRRSPEAPAPSVATAD
jgi:class 3 adenylate cyclase/tetratricopeptide (TPR) repeat protein